jgi:hypothetical protein
MCLYLIMTRYSVCQIEMYHACRNYNAGIAETSDEWVIVAKCGHLTSVQEKECQIHCVVDCIE